MKTPRFNGRRMVIGPHKTVSERAFETDLETNRNSKMIKTLMRRDINGVFLFCFVRSGESVGTEFMMPPGLNELASAQFQREFMQLIEKYARLTKAA